MFRSPKPKPPPPSSDPTLFEKLFEAIPDAMLAIDRAGRITRLNAQAERLSGYARDELLGQPVELLVPERLRPRHQGHRGAFLVHPRLRPMGKGFNLSLRRKDGTELPVDIMLSPLEADTGPLVLAVVRDTSERQRAEQRLRDRIAIFERLFEFAPDAMLAIDVDGNIAHLNTQVERLFGYGRDELLGKPLELLLPERFRARHAAYRQGYFAKPHVRPMGQGLQLFALRADGSEFPVDIMLSPLAIGDDLLALAVIRELPPRAP